MAYLPHQDLFDPHPVWILPQALVLDIIADWSGKTGSSYGLVRSEDRLTGILTEAAVIEAVVQHHSLTGIRVDQVMITPVITLQATEYEDAAATLTFMQQQQIQILPVVNEQGSVLGVFTQERIQQVLLAALKAENSNLQESEFTIKQFLEHSPDFIYINEVATGNQVYSNLACPALYQTRREDYNHQVWLSQIHPDDRQRIETQHLQELEKKQYIEAEYRIVRPDKSERWIWDRRFPIYNRVGEITRYASINRDVTEQKQLEENLKSTLISAIAAIISFRIFADRSIQYDYFSSGCEGIYGYSPEELLSDHNLWKSCLFEGDFESIILPRHQDYFSEQISVVEFRFCHKDGSIRWIYSKAISRRDHRNDCWVVTMIDTDITELKQTQLQLKEQELSYRALVENSQDIIARFDRQLRHLYVNPILEKITGLATDFVIGKTNQELGMPGELTDLWEQALKEVFATSKPKTIEFDFLGAGGSQSFQSLITPELSVDGQVEAVLGITRNITEYKRSEVERKVAEGRCQEIANTISQFFFVKDISGQYLYISPAYEKIWGKSCESLYQNPQSWIESIHPDDRQELSRSLTQQSQGSAVTREYRIIHPDGGIRWIFAQVQPILDAAGNPTRFIGFAEDITDRKILEISLRQSQQKFESLVNSVTGIVWELDPETLHFSYVSQQAQQILGYPLEDWTDWGFWQDHIYVEDQEDTVSTCLALLQRHQNYVLEYRMMTADRRVIWIYNSVKHVIENGQLVKIVGLMIDITERKEAEAALQASETLNRSIIQALPDMLMQLDRDGRYLRFFDCGQVQDYSS